jgi:hypothetical protein
VHAFAIVADSHVGFATIAEFDFNATGFSIDTILDQLFYDSDWSLDHLAGRNLVGHSIGEYADSRHLKLDFNYGRTRVKALTFDGQDLMRSFVC